MLLEESTAKLPSLFSDVLATSAKYAASSLSESSSLLASSELLVTVFSIGATFKLAFTLSVFSVLTDWLLSTTTSSLDTLFEASLGADDESTVISLLFSVKGNVVLLT